MTAAVDYLTILLARLGAAPTPQEVVDVLVPEAADLAQIFVRTGKDLRMIAFRHLDPDQHPVLEELANVHRPAIDHATDPVALVMRSGEPRLSTWIRRADVERATGDTRVQAMFDLLQPRNIVIVPIEREDGCYGALVVVLSSSGRTFIEGDLEFMAAFAAKVGPIMQVP